MGRDKVGRKQSEVDALKLMDALKAWEYVDWQDYFAGDMPGGLEMVDLRIKATPDGDTPLLMVIRARGVDGRRVVAFQAGSHILDVLASAARRVANASIKWRDDRYV